MADRHSKNSVETWSQALLRFSTLHGRERNPDQMRALMERIDSTPLDALVSPAQPVRVRAVERRLGKERVRTLVERYESGVPTRLVAKEFEVSLSTVTRLVRRRGGEVRTNARVTAAVVAEATRLYSQGESVQRIATKLGVPKSSLLRVMKKAGVQLRPPKH